MSTNAQVTPLAYLSPAKLGFHMVRILLTGSLFIWLGAERALAADPWVGFLLVALIAVLLFGWLAGSLPLVKCAWLGRPAFWIEDGRLRCISWRDHSLAVTEVESMSYAPASWWDRLTYPQVALSWIRIKTVGGADWSVIKLPLKGRSAEVAAHIDQAVKAAASCAK